MTTATKAKKVKIKTILVVEDEAAMRQILADELEQAGFAVRQAKDGQEGLRISLKEHPDLILLDILMPIMDGMAMMKKVREDKWGKTVPIILLTNVGEPEKILEGVVNDAPSFYLVKSNWQLSEVVEKVKECLNGSRRRRDYKW